ncbi:LOW QUALITY PROTEIN: histone-lysine N-methyltransferase 2C-like [Tachypleus tridentatus]|uniref:LOW QUALITY PROTEIN: histone-lysine N-methyltransferase 2C-like n=1 Tax=Tachypleus tridentatus TaxID=6853 RepID=UPI003FD1F7A6
MERQEEEGCFHKDIPEDNKTNVLDNSGLAVSQLEPEPARDQNLKTKKQNTFRVSSTNTLNTVSSKPSTLDISVSSTKELYPNVHSENLIPGEPVLISGDEQLGGSTERCLDLNSHTSGIETSKEFNHCSTQPFCLNKSRLTLPLQCVAPLRRGRGRPRKDGSYPVQRKKKFRGRPRIRSRKPEWESSFGSSHSVCLPSQPSVTSSIQGDKVAGETEILTPSVLPTSRIFSQSINFEVSKKPVHLEQDILMQTSVMSSESSTIVPYSSSQGERTIKNFQEKWPGKVCAFCNLCERSVLGQGELKYFESALGFNPFKKSTKLQQGSCKNDDGVLQEKSSKILSERRNCGQLKNTRERIKSPRLGDGCHSCNNPVDELEILGFPDEPDPSMLFEPSGHFYAHHWCATWSEGVCHTEDCGLANIEKAVFAGMSQRCSYCKTVGATIRCKENKCDHVYHYPCAAGSGGFQDMKTLSLWCPLHLNLASTVDGLNVTCNLCKEPGNLRELLLCSICGSHYHGNCLKPPVLVNPVVRTGWQCPDCKICQTCRSPGYNNKMLVCDVCDKGYHMHCVLPVMNSIPKNGWKCKNCRVCGDCGSRTPGNGLSSRWHRNYTVCDSCYQQRNKGIACPLCGKAYRQCTGRAEMTRCKMCRKFIHQECDPQIPKQWQKAVTSPYICPVCRETCQQVSDLRYDVASITQSQFRDESAPASIIPDTSVNMMKELLGSGCDDSVVSVDTNSVDAGKFGSAPSHPLGFTHPNESKFPNYSTTRHLARRGKFLGKRGLGVGRPRGSGKFTGKRSVNISEFQSKRGPKPRGVKSIHLPGIDRSHVPTSSEIKELKSSELGKENKLIFCTTSDEFVLSQDLCVMCGSFGKGEEGRLIACSQCGQCYHPYCVNVKVTKVILSKGWRCLDCTVCEGCGKPHDEGLLLLCDICDISYHTYCLDPPLDDVPQGNWKCNWCVVCLECGSRSPGYGSSWQNNYTCCGPCASKVMCPVCHIDYQENELIIQCIQCYRWLHGGCDQILSEEDAEQVSDHGYHCILCRPVDEQPPHLLSPPFPQTPPKPLPPPTESVHLSSSVEIAKKPESVPPPKPQPQFYVDGVFLSESGMDLIKALTVEQPKKQRMRRPRHSVVEQPLVPGEDKGAVASDITGDQVGMETEVRMEVCDGREDNKELATDASVEKKKRQKKLHKLGIGGFVARQRSRSLSSKEQANEHISIVQEKTDGLRVGEVSTPVVGEPRVELPQPFQQKPKRKRRVKKKSSLQESFPSYLQEAFFGRELLDTCKSESSFEISGDESAGIPIVNQEDVMSMIPPTGVSDEAQSLQISISDTSSLGGALYSAASCTEALLEPMTFSTASFSKHLSLELPGNQEKEGKDILQEKNTSQSKDMDDNFGYTKVSNALPSRPEDTAQQDELMNVEDDTAKQTEVRGCSEFTVTTAPDEVNVRPSAPHFHPTSLPSSGYQPLPQNSATHVPLIHQPTTPSSNIELVSSLPSYTQLSAESGSSQLSAPSSPWPEREQLKTPPQISIHIHKNVLKWESDEALGDKATISSILYTNINMPQLKIEYPNWPDRAKQIAKIWRSLPSEKRQLFVQQAKENRAANRIQKRQADSARGSRKNKEMKEREQEIQAPQQLEMSQEQKEQAPSASTSPARTPVRITSPMMSAPLIPDLIKTGTSSCIPTPPFTVFSDPDFIQATMIGQTLPSHDQISPSQSLPSPSHAQRSPGQSEVASSSNPLIQVSRVRPTEVNHLSPEDINSQPPSTTQPVSTSYFLVSQCPSFISQQSVAQPRAVLSTMSPSKQNRTSGHASLSIPSTDSYSQPSSTLHTFMPQETFLHQSSTSNPDTSLRSGLSSVTLNSVDPCTKVLPDSHSQQFVPNNLSSSSGTPTSRHVSELPYSQPPSFSSADPYSQPVLTPRPADATHTMNDPYARHSRTPHPSCISGTTTTVVSHLVGEPAVSHPEQNLAVPVGLTEETPQMPSQQLRDLLQRHQFIQQQIPIQSWSSATGTLVTSSQSTTLKMSNVQKLGGQDAVNSHIQQGMYNTVIGTSRVTGMEGNFRHPLPPGMRPRFPTSPGQPFGHTTPMFGRKLVSLGGQFNSRLQMVLLPQHQLRGQSLAPGQVRIAGPHPRMSTGFGENVNELCDLQPQKQHSPLPQNQHMTGDLLGSSAQPVVCSSLSQIPEHHKPTVILSVLSHARKEGVNPSVRHCFPVASSELTRQTVSVSQALNQFVISSNCSFTQPLTTCGIMSHITRPAASAISQSVRGLHQHPQSLQAHIIMRQSVASDVNINKALFAHPGHTSTLESKSESSLLETPNFEETPQRRTTPEDLVNVVNEQTVSHEAECELGDELDDDDDELLGLGNDFNILEYADPELVDKGLFEDGEKNNILDEHLDLDDKDDMKCKTDMGNGACRNSIDKDQCISFQAGDKTNVESNEKSFQDAPVSRLGSDNFQAKFSKYSSLERVKDTKEGVLVGFSSSTKSEASDSELVSHLSKVIDSSQKSAEEKQLLSEGVRVPSAESVYQLLIKSGSPVIQAQQGNAEVKPVSQVLTVSQSSISIPVSSSQGSVGVTQLPNKVLLSHSAQYIPNVPSSLSYPIDNTHSSQPSPASSSQHRHFLQRPGQVVTVIPRTSESPVQKSEIGQSDQHSLIENHSLLLEELVQKEKLEQHGKSQDGLVSLPPDALLNDVDFEQLKADVLSCFPDDSFGGPGPMPSAQELSQPTVTSIDKFKLSRPISSQFFHEAQKQRDKSQQLVDWKGHRSCVIFRINSFRISNPHQKHFSEVSNVSASVGSQGGNVTPGEPHVRHATSRQTSPAGSSVTPHPHGFYTITSLPTPPLPPAEPSNDREGQQHSNYEQWLLQQQQLLSSNQKYLETEVGKLRKVKKSLNAKQRTLRKNGQELGEQDAFELDRITQEQAELQKQLDQARKHSRKHNVLFQDYQVKQQKKQLQQHPQIAGTTQLPTQSPVLSQGPPTPYMTDPNAPQSPMLSPSPLGTSQSPQLQHFSTVVSPSSIIQNLPQIVTSQTVAGAMPNLIHTAQNDVTCLNENFQQQEYHSEHQLFSQPSIQQQQLVSPKLHPSPGPLSRNFMMSQIVSRQHSFSPGSQDGQQQCFSPENPNMQQQRFSPGAQQHFVVGSPNSQQPPYSPVLQQQQLSLGAQGVHKARFLLPQPSSVLTPQHQQQISTSGVYQLTQQQPQIVASQDMAPHQKPQQVFSQAVQLQHPPLQNQVSSQQLLSQEGSVGDEVKRQELLQRIQFLRENNISLSQFPGQVGLHFALNSSGGQSRLAVPSGVNPDIIGRQAVPPTCAQEVRPVQMPFYSGRQRPFLPYPTHIRLFSPSSSNPAKTDSVLTTLTTLQNVNPCKSSIVVRGQPTVEVVYSSSGPTFRVVSIHDSERENTQHEALEGGIVNTIGHSLSLSRPNLTSQGTKIVHKIPISQKSNTDFSASAHNQARNVDEESKEVISGSPKGLSCTDKLSQQLFESKLISLKEDNETKGRHLAVEFLEPHEPTKTGQSSVGNIDATGMTENWHTSLLHSDLVSELNQGMLNHTFSTGQRHNNFQFQKEIKIEEVTSTSKIETPQLLNFFQSSSHSNQKDKLSQTTLSSSGNPSSSRYSQKAGISSQPVVYDTVRPSCSSYGSFSDVCNNVSSISVPSERFVSHENMPEKPKSVVQSENRCGSTTSLSSVFVFNQTSDYKLASTRNVSLDESSVHLDPSREGLFSTLIHKQEGIKPEASKITAESFSTSEELRAKEGTVEELGEGTFELFVVGSPEGQTNDSPAPMLPAKEDRTNQEEESGLSCPTDVQTKGKEYRDSTNRNLAGLSTSSSFHTKFSRTKMETEICSGEKDSGSQKSSVPPCTSHNQEKPHVCGSIPPSLPVSVTNTINFTLSQTGMPSVSHPQEEHGLANLIRTNTEDVKSREMVEVQEKTLDDVEIRFSFSETTADENIYRDQGNLHFCKHEIQKESLVGQPQVDIFHKHSLSLEGNVNQKVLLKELLKNSSLGKLRKEIEKVEDIKNNQDTESGPGKVEPCNEDNNKKYPEELKEKKPSYLDLRRAQLEKDPTPPPEDVKPKKKRPKKKKDGPLTKKKQVKGSQGEDDHDTSMDTMMRHVKAISPVTISEPCMKPNFNLCKVFGSGNLRNKVLDCRLRGGYGNATLMSQSDYYSTQPFDSDPPMPTPVPSNSPPVRSYYCDEFVNTVGDPPGFMDVSVSISTPQLFINHKRIIRDAESPETIISSSSPECEMVDPPEIFPGLSFINSNESSSRERLTCSPIAPIVAPIPIRASTNITDGSPTSASDSDEEKDKENVIKAKNQHDLFVYKSKKLRLGKHPVPLKDCGNVAVTLTLSSSESDDIQGVLNALADLLKIPHPTSFEVDCTATSVQKFGLHNKAKHPTVNINQSLLDVKPRFCMHCDVAIVGAGIQKKASELPYSSKDEWEKDEVTFCNTDCYVQFALMHKSTASSDQEKTATVVSHLGNATLSEKCTSTGENKGARISENCWTAEDVAKSETDKPCKNILHVSAESSPTPEVEKTKLDVVQDVANVSAKTKEEERVQDQFVSLNEKTKSNISCEISRAKKHSIVDKHKYSEPLSKKWHGLRWKFWKEGSSSSPMNRNLSEKDLGQTFDTTSVCVKPSRGLKDERMCVLCHEMGDGDTEGPARLLNADVEKWVHLNCALWSAEVYETVNGALINVETAFKRAMVSVCVRCQMIGASLHCFKPRCTNVYHFPCAFQEKCTFYKDKSMLCPQHVPKVPVLDNELESMAVFRRVYINREEHKQIASMIHQGDKYLIRIGSLILCNVGQLLPHQLQAFHSQTSIYPVGYKAVRMYWSIRRLGKRCRYVCSISDFSGKPHFQIQVQEPGHDEFTLKDSTPKGVWQQVLEPIQEMRQQAKTINVFPNFVTGEDLFGLTEPAIVHILESLPGVDSLTDYGFRYGRSSLLDLPLAINPTGCVRTEPKLSTHFKRPHTLHTSNTFKSSLHSTLGEAEANSPYIKQFVHSKSSQYRKMKTDWRNYVYLARSRIQGLGLYAAKNIEKHTVVIEYIGVIIRNEIAERNEREYTKKNRGVYMFRLDENRVIDATLCGGLARYINHSCNPNCVAEEVEIDREKKVLIIANRNITCGEELSYDYRFELENDECKLTCLCGAPNCRKWMN